MPKISENKSMLITIIIIFSISLYLAGVFSGIYAKNITKIETKHDIDILKNETTKNLMLFKEETKKDLTFMSEYVDLLEKSLQNAQLEQLFKENLDEDEICEFSSVNMKNLENELTYYWNRLPFRIEEYESRNILTDDYLSLKEKYTQLSIRTWILAKEHHERCDETMVEGIYFYSNNCKDCVKQGEELDDFQRKIEKENRDIMIFTIDSEQDNTIIRYLLDTHNITKTPALIINGKTFTEGIHSSEELIEAFT